MTKEELLGSSCGPVECDVTGVGKVYVRQITGEDFDYVRSSAANDVNKNGLFARLLIVGVCDESGKPTLKRSDYAKVQAMPISRLKAIGEAVQKHCGLEDEDIDEIAGNSDGTMPSDSGSA